MKKALVCYVTPLDATADIAMTIAEQLSRLGFHVDLRSVSRIRTPLHYRTVILGGASQDDRWHPDAVDYLEECYADGQHCVRLFHTDFRPIAALHDPWEHRAHQAASVPESVRQLAARLGAGPVPIFRPSRHHDDAIRRWATDIGEQLAIRPLLQRLDALVAVPQMSAASR